MTNFEKIKKMDIFEFAKFLSNACGDSKFTDGVSCEWCGNKCPFSWFSKENPETMECPFECIGQESEILLWLRSKNNKLLEEINNVK